jgi:uroporphyrinogen decarboxylase
MEQIVPAQKPPAWQDSPMMKATRLEKCGRVPIWLMRQAGRYMAEYREVRRKTTFLELCKNPSLSAEVMITAVERLTELTDLDRLEFVMETVRQTRAGLAEELPLIGFAGAPFTLASYTIEGGSSRDFALAKTLMYSDQGAWDALMGRLARAVVSYLNAQIEAGCQIVQIFDSWVGSLAAHDYRRYVLPHTKAVVEGITPGVPVINFATGNPALLPLLREAGGDVIGIDWRISLDDAWKTVGYDKAVQGNLDPIILLTDPATIRAHAKQILDQAGGRPGHIFNLGHGVLKQTPVENAIALVEAVHEFGAG